MGVLSGIGCHDWLVVRVEWLKRFVGHCGGLVVTVG